MIFRDDDISQWTKLNEFRKVHELFIKYDVTHTITVICRDIDKHIELLDYLKTTTHLDLQYHCLDHIRHVLNHKQLEDQFSQGVELFEKVFGKKPETWYPTWNEVDPACVAMALKYGMKTSHEKVSMDYYLRHEGDVMHPVINFHYWYEPEQMLLEPCLKLFTGK